MLGMWGPFAISYLQDGVKPLWIIELLKGLPKELIVAIAAALPVSEVRGAVPIGVYFDFPPLKILIISIAASIVPVFPILWFLSTLTERLRKINSFDRFFEWLFNRTRTRSTIIERFEVLGLTLFIAIPFPTTGVWTGCIAAYLFGLPWGHTFLAATVGTTIASLIMLGLSLGVINLW